MDTPAPTQDSNSNLKISKVLCHAPRRKSADSPLPQLHGARGIKPAHGRTVIYDCAWASLPPDFVFQAAEASAAGMQAPP